MIAVIASGITDPNKLRKLTEFAKENESEIKKAVITCMLNVLI